MEENKDLEVINSKEIKADCQTEAEALDAQNALFDSLGVDAQEELSCGRGEDEDE